MTKVSILLFAVAASWSATPAASPEREPYAALAADGRGGILMRVALASFLEASGSPEESPPPLEENEGRPAGPRDEPAPPEWPGAPAGLVVCLEVRGKVRACEGSLEPRPAELGESMAKLASRLPSSRSRGRPRTLKASERRDARIEARFLFEAGGGPAGRGGWAISWPGGSTILLHEEAATAPEALRLARKAGAPREGAVAGRTAEVVLGTIAIEGRAVEER